MRIPKTKNWIIKYKLCFYYLITLVLLFFLLNNNIIYTSNNSFFDILSGTNTVSSNIVIVKIDDKSLQKIGQWPWNKKIFNDALIKIEKDSPRVVAYDILFLENQNDEGTR